MGIDIGTDITEDTPESILKELEGESDRKRMIV
jgi:hypothetical protein